MFTDRIRIYKDIVSTSGDYILYWMQQSQRANYNHALEYAIQQTNAQNQPLLVLFVFDTNFPEANQRHFTFMIEGLLEVEQELKQKNIRLLFEQGDMVSKVVEYSEKAAVVIGDFGYLRVQREWRDIIAKRINKPFICLESDIVVPVEVASDKQEYMARTIRPKIMKRLDDYLIPFLPEIYQGEYLSSYTSITPQDVLKLVDASVKAVASLPGGYSSALEKVEDFLHYKLTNYHLHSKNLVNTNYSELSPYLHFGQISPLEIAHKIEESGAFQDSKSAFIEQLIVRKELAINFCYYNPNYDNYDYINPNWAKTSLEFHLMDNRDYVYSLDELEQAQTHDPAWNAAQLQMVNTGYMHNYLRMYWGKKIIEWSLTPQEAHANMLYLNNKYELDGRDPNAFVGVAWCFGNHDTAWKERDIFGKVRYMNYNGLKRKFDIEKYEEEYL